mmetsp:Transcript_10015/g.15136  ORF Transcript_10015/g.15136 Transcript_10015/m.15136 type:complete len:1476 (+) Transcript_10015:165-4592(+)|eukprot:CAMPEP_0185032584 /NCGR_PEP_ID=MMETSP1103-20130426/20755_1 /TAXON_ID=36769 /ORGANISM="Paraphysomonas bandaiensis, Strain Caron Lab Isolate" /LENGTH=1475 /DNA_ID=CAMNT_0027568537 /DNA_START=70 /DNA_END=4497 /DNA_ORIENTATION=-
MLEELEQLFEDDLDDLSDVDSEGHDEFIAQSIELLKDELANFNNTPAHEETEEWSELLKTADLTGRDLTLEIHSEVEFDIPNENSHSECNVLHCPDACVSVPSINNNMLNAVEIADEVREVLFEMITSVEYIYSISYDNAELLPITSDQGLTTTAPTETQCAVVSNVSDFEEQSIEAVLPFVPEEGGLLYDDLMLHETRHKDNLQVALQEIEVLLQQKDEEYELAVEQDRREREERKKKIASEIEVNANKRRAAIVIQRVSRGLNCRRAYRQMLIGREQMRQSIREREERSRMQRNETQCRAAWNELKRREAEQVERERQKQRDEGKHMTREDGLGERMRIERKREKRAREDMKLMEIESTSAWKAEAEKSRLKAEEDKRREELMKREDEERQREREEMKKKKEQDEVKRRDDDARRKELEEVKRESTGKERYKKANENSKMDKENARTSRVSATQNGDGDTKSMGARPSGSGWGGFISKVKKAVTSTISSQSSSGSKELEKVEVDTARQTHQDKTSSMLNVQATSESAQFTDSIAIDGNADISSQTGRIESVVRECISRSHAPVSFTQPDELAEVPNNASTNCEPSALVSNDFRTDVILHALESWRKYRSESVAMQPTGDISDRSAQVGAVLLVSRQSCGDMKPSSGDRNEHTELKMSVEGLTNLSFVKEYPHLRVLDVNVNKISNLDHLAECECPLEELCIKDNVLTCIKGLRGKESLRTLHLEVNQLTDLSPLQDLPSLVHLSANMNRLTSIPLLSSTSLQKLELYHNKISSVSRDSLHHLQSLTHLDIGRNKLSTVSGDTLSQCPLLSQLVLSQNQLTNLPTPLYLPNLRSLWLSGNKLTNMNAWVEPVRENYSSNVRWPVFMPLLDKLYLQDNSILDIASMSLMTSPYLSEIDLSFNSIPSLEKLTGLLQCNELKVIQLQDNPVNSDSNLAEMICDALHKVVEVSGRAISHPSRDPVASLLSSGSSDSQMISDNKIKRNQQLREFIDASRHSGWHQSLLKSFRTNISCGCAQDTSSRETNNKRGAAANRFTHFLSSLIAEQNVARIWERSSSSQANHVSAEVSFALLDVMRSHVDFLSRWDDGCQHSRIMSIRSSQNGRIRTEPVSLHPSEVSIQRRGSREAQSVYSARIHHAAMCIQSVARGFICRRKLKRVLNSAAYMDEELDAMLGDSDMLAEYANSLSCAPELEDDWLQAPMRSMIRSGQKQSNEGRGLNAEGMVVYGDHRRKRRPQSPGTCTYNDHISQEKESIPCPSIPDTERGTADISPRLQHMYRASARSGEWVTTTPHVMSENDSLEKSGVYLNRSSSKSRISDDQGSGFLPNICVRPTSSSTIASSRPASRSSNLSGASSRFGAGNYDMEEDADMLLHTARSRVSAAGSEQAAEWGISDPTVIEAMMKRNKRMKKFVDAKEKREKERDPSVRYQKFVKTTKGNTNMSGSFGGKPKMVRNNRAKKAAVPPAWMLGTDVDGK